MLPHFRTDKTSLLQWQERRGLMLTKKRTQGKRDTCVTRWPLTHFAFCFVCCVQIFISVRELKSYSCSSEVMWEAKLPPSGPELLAAAFLPLLSGGWRGIICQHAGSHCLWAGTNAASIRQLDSGVCAYCMCGQNCECRWSSMNEHMCIVSYQCGFVYIHVYSTSTVCNCAYAQICVCI